MIPQHGTLEISRSRLLHNLNLIRQRLAPTTHICATLKANAYGHGAALMAQLLHEAQVDWLAVYSLEETRGLTGKLLVLAPLVVKEGSALEEGVIERLDGTEVRVNLTDEYSARVLSESVVDRDEDARTGVRVHMQIDAGLTRSGVDAEKAEALADLIAGLPALTLEGVFAHFSHGDVPEHQATVNQARRFHDIADAIRNKHPNVLLHLQNSGGAFHLQDDALNIARIGIALYGLQPSTENPIDGLLPIARVTAPILAIHEVRPNTGVGYGHTFITRRASRLAIVPVGYAEGYPRSLSNKCVAQIHNAQLPVAGRVSMDQIILDITDAPQATIGDSVTLISWNPADANSLDRMADATGTIGYELATHLGSRLKRQIVD